MTVMGCDYSHWQGTPDVSALAGAGIQFVMIKAWEGNSPDPQFKTNLARARAVRMPLMAYVFLRASDTGANMQNCFDYIDGAALMLDWEGESKIPVSVVNAWQDSYEKRFGRQGALYYGISPPDTPNARVGQWLRVFPEYCTPSQLKLQPWDGGSNPDWRKCWAIWQYSQTGHVAGIDGNADLDQLASVITIDMYKTWLDTGIMPPPVIVPPPLVEDKVKPAIRVLQKELNDAGYNAGTVDGLWGNNTQTAINKYSGYKP